MVSNTRIIIDDNNHDFAFSLSSSISIPSDTACPLLVVSIASSALTNRSSKPPRKGRGCGEEVTEDNAVG